MAIPLLPQAVRADAPRPNIVHILVDDLGWGSVGFNGQSQIATPNLDALAAGGMTLRNAYSAPVCAPSRAMLYTGFHQGHASVDGNNELNDGFRAVDVMTPQVLAPAGYSSAVFGKWGFGADGTRSLSGSDPVPSITAPNSLPNNHGFNEFYGYLNHGAAQDYFYDWMWRTDASAPNGVSTVRNNGGSGGTPQYTHDLISNRSQQFVTAHAGDAAPFYMQVDYTIPHFDIDQIASAPGGFGSYASKPWTASQKAYAAMITRMDASVGALMAQLDDPNGDGDHSDSVRDNTLVIFTSDNGASPTEDNAPVDFFDANGPFRGGKFEVYEGGIHMPALAYWPGVIAPGSTSDYRTDLADFMATAAELAGVETPVGIDGTSLVPTLTGEGVQRQRDYLAFEHQGAHGGDADPRIGRWAVVRQDGMKLIRYDNETQELFNLNVDPDESSPLNLNVAANAQVAVELQAAAVAEGLLRGVVEYRKYIGPSGGNVEQASNWDGVGRPHEFWSASIVNNSATPRLAHVSDDVTTLGVEVRGDLALQAVDIHADKTLLGRNEVRIGDKGRIELDDGTVASSRWINIRAGGQLAGRGTAIGDVYNEGLVSPGRTEEMIAWPVMAPPELPPLSLDTGVVTAATFDFSGVQDDVPLIATSALSPYMEVSHGLNFGPGVNPRLGNGGTDDGNEFNVAGHTATTLAQAIAAGDYLTFTVDPIAGVGAVPNSISFDVRRNGAAAATQFAILSSVDGFDAAAAIQQFSVTNTTQQTLQAVIPAVDAMTEPIEYRLYAWGATAGTGNTHVRAASLKARFVAASTLEFDFAGVQGATPLTDLKRMDSRIVLTSGLSYGSGLSPRGSGNAGSEFNAAGFSAIATLQGAIDAGDYLTFAVQPIDGMALYPDSVSFTMWRDSVDSPTDFALLSSVDGFAAGQQLVQSHQTTIGVGGKFVLTGEFSDAQSTTSPVEFRLYGWNAASNQASLHVTGASMRARFASVVGSAIEPAGVLDVQGDFFHLAGGQLDIDLGGNEAGVGYDAVHVTGAVNLHGDLNVLLLDDGEQEFIPSFGDSFEILTASGGVSGEFGNILLPELTPGLGWFVDYGANAVTLQVIAGADFNYDGNVDAADLAILNAGYGMAEDADKSDGDANNDGAVDGADFLTWQRQYGMSFSGQTAAIPEPSTSLLIAAWLPFACRRRAPLTSAGWRTCRANRT